MVVAIVKGIEELENKDMLIDFLNHEIELLGKKSGSSKLTKVQKENITLKNELYVAMLEFDRPITIAEFKEESNSELAFLSTSKLSALLNQMKDEPNPRIVRVEEKKRAYFSAVREEEETEEVATEETPTEEVATEEVATE
jgi:hypothetical protein